jgi:2-polyprenyl-6-methoxyphenol hydroxylase-like FAD-dependent oxidoreductase
VHRRDLIDGLLAAAADIAIQTGVDIRAHPEALDGVDLVVGADGINSAVRAKTFHDAASAPPPSPARTQERDHEGRSGCCIRLTSHAGIATTAANRTL